MGERTGVAWCDHTFNPWIGCEKVSDGCANCYAERETNRFFTDKSEQIVTGVSPFHGLWKPGAERRALSENYWKQPERWNRKAEKEGIIHFVFCGSWCDVCDPKGPKDSLTRLWNIIRKTPYLCWLFLTKRPERYKEILPVDWDSEKYHVWLGVTAETQASAYERITILLETPAAGRFVSCEPLLETINITPYIGLNAYKCDCGWHNTENELNIAIIGDGIIASCKKCGKRASVYKAINWVIAGGESGPNARPMNPRWVRSIRDQCQEAETPFFFKQWGEWITPNQYSFDIGNPDISFCKHVVIKNTEFYRVWKNAAGCLLDGREWKERPVYTLDFPFGR